MIGEPVTEMQILRRGVCSVRLRFDPACTDKLKRSALWGKSDLFGHVQKITRRAAAEVPSTPVGGGGRGGAVSPGGGASPGRGAGRSLGRRQSSVKAAMVDAMLAEARNEITVTVACLAIGEICGTFQLAFPCHRLIYLILLSDTYCDLERLDVSEWCSMSSKKERILNIGSDTDRSMAAFSESGRFYETTNCYITS